MQLRDQIGCVALVRAVQAGGPHCVEVMELLLKHGAALPDDGLDWALSNAYTPLIRLLMPRATPAMLAWPGPTGGSVSDAGDDGGRAAGCWSECHDRGGLLLRVSEPGPARRWRRRS